MKAEVQRYLAGRTQAARHRPRDMGVTEYAAMMMGHFGGALEALHVAGEITEEENREWGERMAVALGMEPLRPTPPGAIVARRLPGAPAQPPVSQPPQARFVRRVPGPEREAEYHGSRLRIIAVELYDTRTWVLWRVTPPLDPTPLFQGELEVTDRDTEGLPEAERARFRYDLGERLLFDVLHDMVLSDDVGTVYEQGGASSDDGGSGETNGRTGFSPGIPKEAKRLSVKWLGEGLNPADHLTRSGPGRLSSDPDQAEPQVAFDIDVGPCRPPPRRVVPSSSVPPDDRLIAVLRERDGVATEVVLRDGRRCVVMNIAWGYDEGDEWAHVTTNVSPQIAERRMDFFFTSEVTAVRDPSSGVTLYDAP